MDNKDFNVEISTKLLVEDFCKHPEKEYDYANHFALKVREKMLEVFGHLIFREDFMHRFTIHGKGMRLIGDVNPSYSEFLEGLVRLLNVKVSLVVDSEELTEILLERVSVLEKITTKEKLRKEFPLIYGQFCDGNRVMKYVEEREKLGDRSSHITDNRKYLEECGMRKGVRAFVSNQAEAYKSFIEKRLEYKEKIKDINFDKFIKNICEWDYLGMYIAHVYLRACETTYDITVIKYYLSLIYKYIGNSSCDKSISFDIDGVTLNLKNIRNRVARIQEKLREKQREVSWVIVPGGMSDDVVSSSDKKSRNMTMDMERIRNLKRLGEKKEAFYEGTNYAFKVIGLNKYSGYVAHIYPNGVVIMDREYRNGKISTALGDAIYIINVKDFEKLSGLDKTTLRNHPGVLRINHIKNWEEKIEKIIEKDGSLEDMEAVKSLKKKLQTTSLKY